MNQHTPGPWTFDPPRTIRDSNDMRLATVTGGEGSEADARLIAAAPELADALQWALDQIEDSLDPEHQQALAHARAVLANATGGAQ